MPIHREQLAYLISCMNFKVTKQAEDLGVWIKSNPSVLPMGRDSISQESKLYSSTSMQTNISLSPAGTPSIVYTGHTTPGLLLFVHSKNSLANMLVWWTFILLLYLLSLKNYCRQNIAAVKYRHLLKSCTYKKSLAPGRMPSYNVWLQTGSSLCLCKADMINWFKLFPSLGEVDARLIFQVAGLHLNEG